MLSNQYGYLGVPETPKSHDALIEVFKSIGNKLHFCTDIVSETLKICVEVCEPFRQRQPSVRRQWQRPGGIRSSRNGQMIPPQKQLQSNYILSFLHHMHYLISLDGLRTPNKGINQRNLKIWANVADKIWLYLNISEWELIFGRAVKVISSLGVRIS